MCNFSGCHNGNRSFYCDSPLPSELKLKKTKTLVRFVWGTNTSSLSMIVIYTRIGDPSRVYQRTAVSSYGKWMIGWMKFKPNFQSYSCRNSDNFKGSQTFSCNCNVAPESLIFDIWVLLKGFKKIHKSDIFQSGPKWWTNQQIQSVLCIRTQFFHSLSSPLIHLMTGSTVLTDIEMPSNCRLIGFCFGWCKHTNQDEDLNCEKITFSRPTLAAITVLANIPLPVPTSYIEVCVCLFVCVSFPPRVSHIPLNLCLLSRPKLVKCKLPTSFSHTFIQQGVESRFQFKRINWKSKADKRSKCEAWEASDQHMYTRGKCCETERLPLQFGLSCFLTNRYSGQSPRECRGD